MCAARSSRYCSALSDSVSSGQVCGCHPGNRPAMATLPEGQVVQTTESITAAIGRAAPGSEIVVEPGEYRERLILRDNIRLVSRVPRGATIRLPATASDTGPEPAVVVAGLSRAELIGFRIIGDAKTPLGVGILVAASAVSIVDVEVSGATSAGVSFTGPTSASLVGSEIHDNPGAALTILAGARPVSRRMCSAAMACPNTRLGRSSSKRVPRRSFYEMFSLDSPLTSS